MQRATSAENEKRLQSGMVCESTRELKKNIFPQMSQMVTDGCPQADGGGERVLIKDERLLMDIRLLMIDYSFIIYFQRCSSSYASS